MKQTLLSLISAYGATGRETNVANIISEMVKPYVDDITIDSMGNVIATKKGQPGGKRIMLAAHTDHIGFVVIGIEEKGFLRVSNVGGISRNNSFTRRVVFENGVSGVLSHEIQDFNAGNFTMDKMFIDIGAKTREEAEAMVDLGDVAVYAPDIFEMGDRVVGPAMDDRAGCACLIQLLQQEAEYDFTACFTVCEECGKSGADNAAFSVQPDIAIVVECTTAADVHGVSELNQVVNQGQGPCLSFMDNGCIYDRALFRKGLAIAKENNIPCQVKRAVAGGNDSAVIQVTGAGVKVMAVSMPGRYIHSASNVLKISDIDATTQLLGCLVNNLAD